MSPPRQTPISVVKSIAMVDQPLEMRGAYYSMMLGGTLLITSIFLSSDTFMCQEECIRKGEYQLDRLVRCEDKCETVDGKRAANTKFCEQTCSDQTQGTTRRNIARAARTCDTDCIHYPTGIFIASAVGCIVLLNVVPLLGTYTGALNWEGLTMRVCFYAVSCVAYGFSLSVLMPALVEATHEVAGKFLFAFAQSVAVMLMAVSRILHEQNNDPAKVKRPRRGKYAAPTGLSGGGQRPIGSGGGGGDGSEQGVREMQRELKIMQAQVRDLVKIQTEQLQAAQARQGAAAPAARSPAVAAAPVRASSGGAADLMM